MSSHMESKVMDNLLMELYILVYMEKQQVNILLQQLYLENKMIGELLVNMHINIYN